MRMTSMDWIRTGGGPLLCIERDVAHLWMGVRGSSGARGGLESVTDYDRACQVRDYLGTVVVGPRKALVLGDMPLQTMVWRPEHGIPSLVRVFYADPDADVLAILGSGPDLDFSDPIETIDFKVELESFLIFDSARCGSEVGNRHLDLDLPRGHYSILTKQFEPDDRTSVLVHKFIRGL